MAPDGVIYSLQTALSDNYVLDQYRHARRVIAAYIANIGLDEHDSA